MCHLPWNPPKWDNIGIRKHRKANKRLWDRSMITAMTAEKDEPSQFDPNLSDAVLEKMILDCIKDENLIYEKCHKKTYFGQMGTEIGASDGHKTTFLFVEYVNEGLVHGWPITEEQLRRKRKK